MLQWWASSTELAYKAGSEYILFWIELLVSSNTVLSRGRTEPLLMLCIPSLARRASWFPVASCYKYTNSSNPGLSLPTWVVSGIRLSPRHGARPSGISSLLCSLSTDHFSGPQFPYLSNKGFGGQILKNWSENYKILDKYKPPLLWEDFLTSLAEKALALEGSGQSQTPNGQCKGGDKEEEEGCSVLGVSCLPASHRADKLKSDGSPEEEGSGPEDKLVCKHNSFQMPPHHKFSGLQIINLHNSASKISAAGGRRMSEVPSCESSLSRSEEPSLTAFSLSYLPLIGNLVNQPCKKTSNLSTRGSNDSSQEGFHPARLVTKAPIYVLHYLDAFKRIAGLAKKELMYCWHILAKFITFV